MKEHKCTRYILQLRYREREKKRDRKGKSKLQWNELVGK